MTRHRENILGRGNRRCRGFEVGTSLVKLKNKKNATPAREKGMRESAADSRREPGHVGCGKELGTLLPEWSSSSHTFLQVCHPNGDWWGF